MKNALAWVAVLCLVGSAAVAEPFVTTKDNSILGYDDGTYSERYQNCGASWRNRIAKRTQHQMILDFDTAAVLSWQAANPLSGGQYYQYEFFLKLDRYWPTPPASSSVQVHTLNVGDDWAEGDDNWGNDFDWSAGTAASVWYYAQCYWMDDGAGGRILDPNLSVPWKLEDGTVLGGFDGLVHKYQNALDFVGDSDGHGNYVGVVLDDDLDPLNANLLADDLLNNVKNRGLRTWRYLRANDRVRFREAGAGDEPYLEVTIVPEPVSLALLGLGGLGLLIRRKRPARRARACS